MYYSSDGKIVLLIQPPAGTADALMKSGIYRPYEIDYIYQPNIRHILNQIKAKAYQLIILGMAVGGSLETGLELIDQMLKTSFTFPTIKVIIYTYQSLIGNLQSFIQKNGKNYLTTGNC